MRHFATAPLLLALAACAAPSATEPSLGRRAAEAIDPRLPLPADAPQGAVAPALANRLGQLIAQGKEGARTFDAETDHAEALANAAGPARSESWIAAQQALSALEGARAKTTAALADIDSIASARIEGGANLGPAELAAVNAASAELGAIAARQEELMARLQARLR